MATPDHFPQYNDAVHLAAQLGRLDFVSAVLGSIAIILAIGGLFAFFSIRRAAKETAAETAREIAGSTAERVANEYLVEKLPEILESYREFIGGRVTVEVGNQIARAQDDSASNVVCDD